ncbi:hypothetical protein QP794_03780 [Paenibacillus sp. UMB7766-LJ446]|uniref:DUF6973 domain-containing protein n=1 Tax=Paenibacillus sp. UMB7766-LJ446 TaxID=3046313 RepID=UPI00254E5B2C|nr:hypothetical protein [Paenibacillus sp. UMB7766-LJ446]MDK8189201.1 hypothetical protein [Paenibacillus sp. UMB7766-LJ446]
MKYKKVSISLMSAVLVFSMSSAVFASEGISTQDSRHEIQKEEVKVDVSQPTDIERQAIERENKGKLSLKSNKTYPDAISKLNYDNKDIIFEELKTFEKSNPEASEDQINDYFISLCEKYSESPSRNNTLATAGIDSTFYNLVEGMVDLNSKEKELYAENPSRGFKAIVAGDEAAKYTEYKFGRNGHNDKTDAFRHAAWNIWIVGFTDSVGWAKSWTDAHETHAPGNQPAIEFNMDINNNTEGRVQAINSNISTSSSVTATRNAIKAVYKSGKLQHIVNGSRVNFVGKDSDFVNQAN